MQHSSSSIVKHKKQTIMKKTIIAIIISSASLPTYAQGVNLGQSGYIDRETFNTIAITIILVLIMSFILNVLKKILEYKLKNKIVNKGIPQEAASSILQTEEQENKNAPVKWFALLAGLGVGLTIVNYTQPLGIHSLAIMSFSIAFAFLGYFLFVRNK
jgi:hypothetical protein